MELRELKTFSAAARFRSISKAAEHLQIGQPNASTHIRNLEREIGVPLFDRVKRPIQLTSAGNDLLQRASPIVEAMETLVAEMATARDAGTVTVATTADIMSHKLLSVVRLFRIAHPLVRVLLRSRPRHEVLGLVESGAVDLGIIPGAERRPDMDFEGLFPYERVLITRVDHPLMAKDAIDLEDIAGSPLILMGPQTYTRGLLDAEFQRRGIRYDVVVELDSMDMIKRYVSLGMGISVGPALAIDPLDRQGLGVRSLAHLLPVEQVVMATMRGKHLAPRVLDFADALRRELRSG